MGEVCFQLEQDAKKQGEGLKLHNWFKCLRHCGIESQAHSYHELLPTPSLPNKGGGKELHSNVNKSLAAWLPSCLAAFTLAEVLITLGIIGVVAAITMPTLIQNHQKSQTIAKLKKAYSEIGQTLQRAEVDYGTMDSWDFSDYTDTSTSESIALKNNYFFDNYIQPYISPIKVCKYPDYSQCWSYDLKLLKGTKVGEPTTGVAFITSSGYSVRFWIHASNNQYGGHFLIDTNGPLKGPNQYGKDVFRFLLTMNEAVTGFNDTNNYNRGLRGYGLTNIATREDLLTDCSKTGNGYTCSGLIIYDNWQMSKDYPY